MSELVMKYQQYAEYKDSGVEWLGEIPKNWEVVRLKYIAELSGNKVSGSENQYVGLENVESKTGKFKVTEGIVSEGVSNTFEKDNLLFGKLRPYLAKSWLASFSGICSSEFLVLNSQLVHPKFLKYMTLTDEFVEQVNSSTYGSKMPRASWDFIGLLQLPVMDYGVSETIANFLDHETAQIDTLIEKQQTLISLLKEKRQAVISHAVTKGLNPDAPMKDSGVEWLGEVPEHWVVSKLKFESEIIDCRNKTPEYFENGEYFVVRTTNVRHQKLNFNGALYTDKKNFTIWTQRGVPPAGSIFFTREAPTGEVCLVPEDLKFCMGQRMMNFIAHDESYTNYLFDYLISDCLDRYINSVSHGSTVTHLRVEQVQNIPVLVPPLEEVVQIHNHIEQLKLSFEDIESNAKQAIQLMQERRTALISAAVTGKIDVRGWVAPDGEVV